MTAYLTVILLCLALGFVLSRLPLKMAIVGALVLPFAIVYGLNFIWEQFVTPSSPGAPLAEVAYITVSLPGVIFVLLFLWLFRKFLPKQAKD